MSLLFLFAVGPAFSQTNPPAIVPAGKIELFDGKSFDGWTFFTKGTNGPADAIWSVTNGVIRCLGKPAGYARTLKMYRDYKLHAEWRFPDGPGNSGLFLHINLPDKVWPLCFEAQLQSGSAGEVRLNGGSRIDSLTDPAAKSVPHQQPSSEKPVGEWNAYDILCISNTILVRVNGVTQNEIVGTSVTSGAIGLQAEGKPIEFRNIYLEPVPGEAVKP
jgi:3-keto-disaccharide hydrolase